MSTYYVAESTKPGDSVRWEDLEATPRKYGYASELDDPITKRIEVIDECTHGKWFGGTVEQSNYRVLDEDKKASRYLVRLYGDYGTQGLAYIPRKKDGEAPKPVQEYLEGLASYCLISDDDHSELEHELESKAWQDDGHDDFVKALGEYLDEQDPGFEHDLDIVDGEDFRDRIFELWCEGCETFLGGESCQHEHGGSVYFPIRKWFEKASRSYGEGSSYDVRTVLMALAHETGFDCEVMRGALSVARDAFLSHDELRQRALIEAARSEACERSREREATASELTSRCS